MSTNHANVARRDVVIGLSAVTTGLLMAAAVGLPAGSWWVGALVTVAAGGLAAASYRTRLGPWLLAGGGLVAMAFVVCVVYARPVSFDVVPLLLVGIGVGVAANRFVFGVHLDVPPERVQRERAE